MFFFLHQSNIIHTICIFSDAKCKLIQKAWCLLTFIKSPMVSVSQKLSPPLERRSICKALSHLEHILLTQSRYHDIMNVSVATTWKANSDCRKIYCCHQRIGPFRSRFTHGFLCFSPSFRAWYHVYKE